jgi:hypothetical protein
VLRRRRGRAYDPAVVDVFLADGAAWLAATDDDPCVAVLEREPRPIRMIAVGELDGAVAALDDFADVKSPWFRGHSPGVARLAEAAPRVAGQ